MQKTMFLLAAMLLAASSAMAERIDRSEALKTASEFFGGAAGRKMAPAKGDATLRPAGEGRAYYAFNRGEGSGYVIVAADDRAAASVLGYADSGTFSAERMPAAMRWWLDEYARQIENAATQPATAGRVEESLAQREDIAPLLTSQWGQDAPYNQLCPEYGGELCPTGCLATAMAQIMRYHKWPEQGTGSHSYTWKVDGRNMGTLSADFSQSTYNWDAMTDTYGAESTGEQKDAVARLMYDVGVACDMQYNPLGSGATASAAVGALQQYFGYSRSVNLEYREYYTIDEWEELAYSSLAQGLPLLYGGTTSGNEGHAFVCDGYRDGYFHINWGWEGVSNGYFLLSALNPDVQGTGGSGSGYGYNYYQDMMSLRPAKADDVAVPMVCCGGSFGVREASVSLSGAAVFTGGFWNYSAGTFNLTFGVKVVGEDGTATYIESGESGTYDPNYGCSFFRVKASAFPADGKLYSVYPVCRDDATGTWYDIKVQPATGKGYLTAEATAQGIRFSVPETESGKLEVTGLELVSKAYAGGLFKVKARLTNSGAEYFDDVKVAMVEPGQMRPVAMSDPVLAALRQGESRDAEFTMTASVRAGTYELVVINADDAIISDRMTMTVEESPQSETVLSLPSAPTVAGGGNVSADNISVTAQVECTSGYYNGTFYALVFPEGDTQNYETMFTSDLYVSAGETATVNFSGQLPGAAVGDRYTLILYYLKGGNILAAINSDNNEVHFTIGSLTPVEGVEASDGPHDIEVYTTAGVRVLRQKADEADLSALQPGLYIVKENGKSRKVVKR